MFWGGLFHWDEHYYQEESMPLLSETIDTIVAWGNKDGDLGDLVCVDLRAK